jgi:hypothetical protein
MVKVVNHKFFNSQPIMSTANDYKKVPVHANLLSSMKFNVFSSKYEEKMCGPEGKKTAKPFTKFYVVPVKYNETYKWLTQTKSLWAKEGKIYAPFAKWGGAKGFEIVKHMDQDCIVIEPDSTFTISIWKKRTDVNLGCTVQLMNISSNPSRDPKEGTDEHMFFFTARECKIINKSERIFDDTNMPLPHGAPEEDEGNMFIQPVSFGLQEETEKFYVTDVNVNTEWNDFAKDKAKDESHLEYPSQIHFTIDRKSINDDGEDITTTARLTMYAEKVVSMGFTDGLHATNFWTMLSENQELFSSLKAVFTLYVNRTQTALKFPENNDNESKKNIVCGVSAVQLDFASFLRSCIELSAPFVKNVLMSIRDGKAPSMLTGGAPFAGSIVGEPISCDLENDNFLNLKRCPGEVLDVLLKDGTESDFTFHLGQWTKEKARFQTLIDQSTQNAEDFIGGLLEVQFGGIVSDSNALSSILSTFDEDDVEKRPFDIYAVRKVSDVTDKRKSTSDE